MRSWESARPSKKEGLGSDSQDPMDQISTMTMMS